MKLRVMYPVGETRHEREQERQGELEAQALSLPIDARASLARRLLKSLEEVSEAECERLWGEESSAARQKPTQGERGLRLERRSPARPDPCSRELQLPP